MRKHGKDGTLLVAALLLLLAPAVAWVLLSSSARARRETALSTVPSFPERGQPTDRRSRSTPIERQQAAAVRASSFTSPPLPAPVPASAADPLAAFLGTRSDPLALVRVNALFNTPLFERLKECLPRDFEDLQTHARTLGFDLERDLDRVAFMPAGVVAAGFFAGKPVAEAMGREALADSRREYRGASIYSTQRECMAQLGNLLFFTEGSGCESLVDRALDGQPDEEAVADAYGDLYFRTGLNVLGRIAAEMRREESDVYGTLLQNLSGVTLRANVWDSVAMSIEAEPAQGSSARDLASMARAAIRLARSQIAEDEVELQALAELATVADGSDLVEVQLALPVKDLFEKLHFPCPGRSRDAGFAP